MVYFLLFFQCFQESPMPEPHELFTNVYAKGYGVEVQFFSSFMYTLFSIVFNWFIPF